MIEYIIQKWKEALNIGCHEKLHYLERQRIAILNAISVIVIFVSISITIIYYVLDFSNKFIFMIT